MERPHYSIPFPRLISPLVRVLLGIPSSVTKDAALLLHGINPPPLVLNSQNIPRTGSFILILNHYDRPGLGAWWGACALICAVAENRAIDTRMRLLMTSEWWYAGGFGRAVKQPLTRWFFNKLAKAYGLVLLPPVLGHHELRGEGVAGVRRGLALMRGLSPPVVVIAPEGRTGENATLCRPPGGTGLFLLLLANRHLPLLPAGIFEGENGVLTVNFGEPFLLREPESANRSSQDAALAEQAMVEIGKTLPARMWGVYQDRIEKAQAVAPA